MIPAAAEEIKGFKGFIIATQDTHFEDYLKTEEGKKLPFKHCIKGTDGWKINEEIKSAITEKHEKDKVVFVEKNTFGSVDLAKLIKEKAKKADISIEIIGLCTDICVISNALVLKANFPEAKISVKADCCAGVTVEKHEAALEVMRSCQIDVI